MARSDEDIIEIEFDLTTRISLDLERIEEDPIWKMLCMTNSPEETPKNLIKQYLIYYILREKIFTEMPSTNGPSSIQLLGEIR